MDELDPRRLRAKLAEILNESRQESQSINETYEKARQKLEWSRHFDHLDKDRVIIKTKEHNENGVYFDFGRPLVAPWWPKETSFTVR